MKQNPKKLISLIVVALCGCLPLYSGAQSSSRHLYKTLTGDNVRITSNCLSGFSIISYNDHTNFRPYRFVFHQQGTNTTFCYQSSSGNSQSNTPDRYDVKDIDVIGNYCYFCGTYYITTFEYLESGELMIVTTEHGYIGRFLVSNIANGVSPMPIQFCIIPETKTLNKLVGFHGVPYSYIYLIGEHTLGLSCLATVKESSSSISYGIHTIDDPAETLTDLDLTDNYLVTVSRYSAAPYDFILRAESISNTITALANSTSLPMFPYKNTCSTYAINTQPDVRPENPTFHSDKVEMKIANSNYQEFAVVAYDCYGGAFDNECSSDLYHTAMFYFDFASYNPVQNNVPPSVQDAQLVSKAQAVDKSLTGLACPSQYSVVLFHNYPSGTGDHSGEMQFPSWLITGQIDNLLIDHRDMQDMSVDICNQKATLAGFQRTDSRIVHFWQDYLHTENSCYSTHPKALSEAMDLPYMTLSTTDIETTYSNVNWGHQLNRPVVLTDCIMECKTN